MDALDPILNSLRLTAPLVAELRLGRDGAIAMPSAAAIPFHYVASGRCEILTDESRIPLEAGEMLLLPRGPSYIIRAHAAARAIELADALDQNSLPTWSPERPLLRPLVMQVGNAQPMSTILSGLFAFDSPHAQRLHQDLPNHICTHHSEGGLAPLLDASLEFVRSEAGRPGYTSVATRLLELLLVQVLRTWILRTEHQSGWLRGLLDPVIARTLVAIHRDPGRPWTLDLLATASGRSRSGFAERFTRVMACTPFDYIKKLRLQISADRLATTTDSVGEIAASLGYGGSFAFGRAFRAHFGTTPTEHRAVSRASAPRA
jgi:AraC-like DNA-binding protein